MSAVRELLDRAASQRPAAEAVVAGPTRVTWGDVAAAATGFAATLAGNGLGPSARLAMLLPNGVEFVVGFFGGAELGATLVPLSLAFRDDEISGYLAAADVDAVLTDAQGAARVGPLVEDFGRRPAVLQMTAAGVERIGTSSTGGGREREGSGHDLLIQFSSGSTGKSKMVVRTDAAVAAEAEAFHVSAGTDADDVFLCCVPLHHAHGLANAMLAAVRSAGRMVLEPSFQRGRTLEILEAERITVFPAVPLVFQTLAASRHVGDADLTALRLAFTAGAPLAPEISDSFNAVTGRPVRQLYGCTEAGAVCFNVAGPMPATVESVGPPLHGLRVGVVDDEGDPCAPGVAGTVTIDGPTLFRGYLVEGGMDRTAFRDTTYVTGDSGQLADDGALYLRGRKTKFINVAGSKVDPAEVEGVIAAIPGVTEVAVIGIPGRAGTELVKAVVVVADEGVDRRAVTQACQRSLAAFKVPRVVEFRDQLPRNPMGKLLAKYLLEEGS